MKVCEKVESKGRTTYNEGVWQSFCTTTTSPVIYQLMQVSNALVMLGSHFYSRRRGKTPKEDYMLETRLLHNAKKCAEHIMLVDLGRNDVGKVSKPGSVAIEKLMKDERYSHVMHISSTVII